MPEWGGASRGGSRGRRRRLAIWGMGIMVGPILGPTLGGYLTEFYSWRWVFYINLPVGILAFLGVMAFVGETKIRKVPFDVLGFTFLSLALGALQMALDRGQLKDWFSSSEIVIEFSLGIFALYAFIVQMFTAEHPFHRFVARALVLDSVLGSARELPTVIGARLISAGTIPRLVDL